MSNLKQSRQSQLDIDLIRSNHNIYDAIIKASGRAYRLRCGAKPRIKDYSDPYNSGVMTALLELQEGKL